MIGILINYKFPDSNIQDNFLTDYFSSYYGFPFLFLWVERGFGELDSAGILSWKGLLANIAIDYLVICLLTLIVRKFINYYLLRNNKLNLPITQKGILVIVLSSIALLINIFLVFMFNYMKRIGIPLGDFSQNIIAIILFLVFSIPPLVISAISIKNKEKSKFMRVGFNLSVIVNVLGILAIIFTIMPH
jgi:hypothetical protein